jgi:hypothetical protein
MSDYTMAQAKRDFQRGYITGASLVAPLPSEGGWWVIVESSGGLEPGGSPLVDARTKQVRYFKTADAAINALHQIGFSPASSLVVGRQR